MLAAVVGRQLDVVDALLQQQDLFLDIVDSDGRNAIYLACDSDDFSTELLDMLIRAGVSVDAPNVENTTPLMVAVRRDRMSKAARLVRAGANVSPWSRHPAHRNDFDRSILHKILAPHPFYARSGLPDLVKVLVSNRRMLRDIEIMGAFELPMVRSFEWAKSTPMFVLAYTRRVTEMGYHLEVGANANATVFLYPRKDDSLESTSERDDILASGGYLTGEPTAFTLLGALFRTWWGTPTMMTTAVSRTQPSITCLSTLGPSSSVASAPRWTRSSHAA